MNAYRSQLQWTFGGRLTPMVKKLIWANCIIFLAQLIFEKWIGWDPSLLFGLVTSVVLHEGYAWQLVTYLFLHGHLMHLFFNMLVLWMLGGEIEEKVFWSKGFLKYYLICGIGAGLFNLLFSYQSHVPIIGASGAIYGILVAYAVFFGNRQLILFPLPFLIRAKHMVLIIALIELVSSLFYTMDGIAHVAHLGGMLVGYIYIQYKLNGPKKMWNNFRLQFRKKKKYPFDIIDSAEA